MDDKIYLLVALAIIIIALLVYILWYSKNNNAKKNNFKKELNYHALFILGICYLPLGLTLKNPAFLAMSLIFMGVGFYHRDKWVEAKKINKISKVNYKTLIGFLLVIVVGLFVGGLASYQEYFKKEKNIDSEKFAIHKIDGLPMESFGNNQIEEAIINYLVTQKDFVWKTQDDSHSFCAIKNLKPEKELFPLYVWVYCGEFIIQDNELKELSGSSLPARIDYPNELSYYDLSKFSHKIPGDGASYAKDLKNIFPEDVQEEISDQDLDNLIEKSKKHAFTNISNWNSIKQAIANCEIKSVMQTHSLEVTAVFKNEEEITAREPNIDNIFDLINQYTDKCGEIIMATE